MKVPASELSQYRKKIVPVFFFENPAGLRPNRRNVTFCRARGVEYRNISRPDSIAQNLAATKCQVGFPESFVSLPVLGDIIVVWLKNGLRVLILNTVCLAVAPTPRSITPKPSLPSRHIPIEHGA